MKRRYASICFLLYSFYAFGQIEWTGNNAFSESATDLMRTSQGQYILVHNGLTVFDSTGNIVFSALDNDYPDWDGLVWFSEIIEMPDSSIIVSASWGECDVIIETLVKFDKNWNQVWMEYIGINGPLAQLNDSSFIYAQYGSITKRHASNGSIIWDNALSVFNVNDLVAMPAGNIVLATSNGIQTMTADGAIVDSFPNIILEKVWLLPSGNYLGQSSDLLLLYSPDFTQLDFFQQQGEGFKDVEIGQNEIAVLTTAAKIIRLDFDLNAIGTTSLPNHNQDFTALTMAAGGFMLAGSERYGNDDHRNFSAFIKQFSVNGSTMNTAEDAALTTVSQNGPLDVSEVWNLFTITIPGIELAVKNNGSAPIDNLKINFSRPDAAGFPCPFSNTFSKEFENLNLMPGTSTTLNWGELRIHTWEDFSGEQIELCFWTSLPNHHLETNNENDVNCTEVLVAAHEPLPLSYHHAFNAVADVLYLEMQSPLVQEKTTAHIFNAAGQLVYKTAITEQRQTLELQDLPDGAYFLQIVSGERVGWGKFAKY